MATTLKYRASPQGVFGTIELANDAIEALAGGVIPPGIVWLCEIDDVQHSAYPGDFQFASEIPPLTSPVIIRKTAAYTITSLDEEVYGNTDGGSYVFSLPAGSQDELLRMVNTGSSGNILTISPNGSQHLLGTNSDFILNDGEALYIRYDADDGWY